MKNFSILIDDERQVHDIDYVDFDYNSLDWIIVRNYNDFVNVIHDLGMPKIVSFDHDLTPDHVRECLLAREQKRNFDYTQFEFKGELTGYHCASFLKHWAITNKEDMCPYLVHSKNERGRQNIKELLGLEKFIAETDASRLIIDSTRSLPPMEKKMVEYIKVNGGDLLEASNFI